MIIESLLSCIPLIEMEYSGIIAISGKAVIHRAGFELHEPCGLGVDGFEGICVLWVGVDGAEDDEFVFGEWGKFGEEFSVVEVGHFEIF